MGRPYPTHTKMGKVMKERGLRVHDVSLGANVYHRLMSDYLAGNKPPSTAMTYRLSQFFKLPPESIIESEYPYTAKMAAEKEAKRLAKLAQLNEVMESEKQSA